MSLADQSQQWFPTNVQVTVHQARNLRSKGKNGTSDAYAIIQMAKDKFSTSVSEKCLDPVWKEEASFDLPLFHPSNTERCTLYIVVMHRAQVGLDKFLGQAVVNLLELHDNNPRKKMDWFKLVDKSGKEDKARGEVLLDIQFFRNNMSASMIDLSMQDKPRSRISKLKDKVRGKKKDGLSDSASAIVPSVSNVLTDSEGEADTQSLNQSEGVKKKSKLKSLFAPKSNLHRNISQSMSTLGTLPEKNSSLSGSRSSGLNIDSPDGKKKFKFRGHKRTGSSDSKVSLGAFSLLGRSKQSNSDANKMCVNGNHVYAKEKEPAENSGSIHSLNSSGQGSVEDVHKFTEICVDRPSYQQESTDSAIPEQQHHQEEQEEQRRQAEEWRLAEAKRLEEEEKHRVEVQRLREKEERRQQEEQERKRRFLEDEERRKQEEAARLEEERRGAEEQKRQEEASMTDRLSSLFGMIRKKEEKKEELPTTAPFSDSGDPDQLVSLDSTNPFEDIPLSPEPPVSSNESPADDQQSSRNPLIPSAMVFLNRSAKVSAVKPRFTQSLESDPADYQTPSQLYPSSAESTFSSVPSDSPDTFSGLHSSLAPAITSESPAGSPRGSLEDLSSAGTSPTMADKWRRAPTPPSYASHGNQNGVPVRDATSPISVDIDGKAGRKLSLPLPDYETLFPQKRHGVQGQTRWDHIIAEVNQKHRDFEEMSVDGPETREPSLRSSFPQEIPAMGHFQTQPQDTKPTSLKKYAAPAPPKSVVSSYLQAADSSLSVTSRDVAKKALLPPTATNAPKPTSQVDLDITWPDDQREVNKNAPTAKPRLRNSYAEPAQPEDPALIPGTDIKSYIQTSSFSSIDLKGSPEKENIDFDPFPSTELLSNDPWAQLTNNKKDNYQLPKDQKIEDQGMTPDDLDQIFGQEKQTDPFADFNGKDNGYMKKDDDSKQEGPVIQKRNSQRRKLNLPSATPSDNTTSKSRQEPKTTVTTAYKGLSARGGRNDSITPKPPAEVKTQSNFHAGEDQFGADPFISTMTFSEPLQVVVEEAEPAPPGGGLSGGKSPLRAWVSPSDTQSVSAQSSNGGGLVFTPRRPHAVKPMNSENQYPFSNPAVKEIKIRETTPGKTQVADSVDSGPFTQLTQEELITLVVRQQADLSRKDSKIVELEEYIDNLLVRVIDEQPNILHALNTKPV